MVIKRDMWCGHCVDVTTHTTTEQDTYVELGDSGIAQSLWRCLSCATSKVGWTAPKGTYNMMDAQAEKEDIQPNVVKYVLLPTTMFALPEGTDREALQKVLNDILTADMESIVADFGGSVHVSFHLATAEEYLDFFMGDLLTSDTIEGDIDGPSSA